MIMIFNTEAQSTQRLSSETLLCDLCASVLKIFTAGQGSYFRHVPESLRNISFIINV